MLLILFAYVTLVLGTRKLVIDGDRLLITRWYLFRTPWLKMYLHQMHAHDVSPYLHDHPWTWSRALILRGGYLCTQQDDVRLPVHEVYYRAGDTNVINRRFHRIDDVSEGTWSLFVAGQRTKSWGFRVGDMTVDHSKMGRM